MAWWSSLREEIAKPQPLMMMNSILANLKKRGCNNSRSCLSAASVFQQRCSFATKVAKDAEAAYERQSAEDDAVLTSGLSRPLSEVLKELNKKVPDSLISARTEPNGFSVKYIPWHIVNRIMNLHAPGSPNALNVPEWSGEVRSITYSANGKSVSVVYRVTLYGTDAEIYRESTGTAAVDEPGYGDAVQKAEAMAFRRACARLGLGLHLYHEDAL